MTWDPYGMPHAPADTPDMQEKTGRRLDAEPTPVSLRAIVAALAGIALLALVLSGVANAQQTTTEQEQQTQEQQGQEQQAQEQQAQEQQAQEQAKQEPAQTGAGTAEQEAAAAPLEGQFVEQPEGTYVASALIGSSVFSAEGEDIGQISDLLVSEDDRIIGVIIGVGGFLGIGEKPIAVELDRLQRTSTQDGGEQLVSNFTREELEQAPQFVSLAEQKRRQEAEQARQQQEMLQQQQGSGGTGEQSTQY